MASACRPSWVVAASVGAVEASKDQGGMCRWNYAVRSLHQHAKNKMVSLSQARGMSSFIEGRIKESDVEKAKQSEESLRKVMYLSSWGPN